MANQLRVDNRDCERMHVQMSHTSVALGRTNARSDSAVFHTPRAVAMNAAKRKQFDLWQLDECDLTVKAWEAREIQLEVRVGAKRECLSKMVAWLEHDRIDDDAEDERDKEVLCELLISTVLRKPWSISMEETDRAWSATRQLCHYFIQDSSTTGRANQFGSHV